MADRFLAEYNHHGSGNPAASKPVVVKPIQPGENAGNKDKRADKKRKMDEKALRATTSPVQLSAGATGSGNKTPQGLCYSFACNFFSVPNQKGCTFVGSGNEHPPLLPPHAGQDNIKGNDASMSSVPLRDKLIQQINDA